MPLLWFAEMHVSHDLLISFVQPHTPRSTQSSSIWRTAWLLAAWWSLILCNGHSSAVVMRVRAITKIWSPTFLLKSHCRDVVSSVDSWRKVCCCLLFLIILITHFVDDKSRWWSSQAQPCRCAACSSDIVALYVLSSLAMLQACVQSSIRVMLLL